jgi:hypothetical protein
MKILGIVAVVFSLAGCTVDNCVSYLDRYMERRLLNETCMITPACQLTTEDLHQEYLFALDADAACGKRNK